jgi:hypothetical protein
MATNRAKSARDGEFSLLGLAMFAVVVGLFLFVSTKAGTRGVGVCMLGGALIQLREGRIAYGWEGRPPSGHISGWPAKLVSVVFGALGLAVLIWPDVAMGVLGWDSK